VIGAAEKLSIKSETLEGFDNSGQGNDQYDQPLACRISWYADGSNGYTGINRTADMPNTPPTISLSDETQLRVSINHDSTPVNANHSDRNRSLEEKEKNKTPASLNFSMHLFCYYA